MEMLILWGFFQGQVPKVIPFNMSEGMMRPKLPVDYNKICKRFPLVNSTAQYNDVWMTPVSVWVVVYYLILLNQNQMFSHV